MYLVFISFALTVGGMALGIRRWCEATRVKCRFCKVEVAVVRDCGLAMCKACSVDLHNGCCDVCVGRSLAMMCDNCKEFITKKYLKRKRNYDT